MSELIPTGVTFGAGRQSINSAFSGEAQFNIISATTYYSGDTELSLVIGGGGSSLFTNGAGTDSIIPIAGLNTASGTSAFVAGGTNNNASGSRSHAEGTNTTSSGSYSHAEGKGSIATGSSSHAEGNYTQANGSNSHAQGNQSQANGSTSHAGGSFCTADGSFSHVGGRFSNSSGVASFGHGKNVSVGNYSVGFGKYSTASGFYSAVSGKYNDVDGDYSSSGGKGSQVDGRFSFSHSEYSTVVANHSVILGGKDNQIISGATGSTILGGSSVIGTSADTTYTPSLVLTNDFVIIPKSPSQITSDQNNYSESVLKSHLRLNSDASRNLTGLQGGVTGKVLYISNVGSFNIILTNEDALSTASNRMILGNAAANITMLPDQTVTLIYDSTASRWRHVNTSA